METRKLGNRGPEVSRLCFGTLTVSPLQRDLRPEDGARLLIHARERGVNFLDTSEFYRNYEPIRLALRECPDYVVCAKAYCFDEKTARASLEAALRGLGRDYIDMFLLHEQESIYTLRGHEQALAYLAKQKERGVVGMTGVSTHFVGCVRSARLFPNVDVIMPLINIAGVGIADGTREQMEDAAREARAAGIGVYGMKALGGGSLLVRREEALAYALSLPFLDSIAIGMQTADEIDWNCDFFEGRASSPALAERIGAQSRRLLIDDWCVGCGRCVRRCKQNALRVENGQCRVDASKCALCGYCAASCPEFCIKII